MVERVVGELSKGLVERDCEVRLLLLAALSREHIILLGPPGTGKSELARRLGRISGGLYFERLLTKFTSPEELFGPLSLASLERDEFVRSIGGYLPCASVAFLDEAFKSSSAILNSLLTILNERKFDNGASSVKVPLLTVVGASNELPDSEELDAFYDRFLIRKLVEPISDANVHLLFLPGPAQSQEENAGESLLVNEALADEIFLKSQSVDLPPQVVSLLVGIRAYLRDKVSPPVYVSDRRLKKAAGALRVAALCNGRRSVSITDCLLLEHILWFAPEEQEVVSNYLWDHIVPSADGEIASFGFLADAILRRLSDALLSDNESAFAAETMELEKLTGVVQQRLTEAKQLANELSSTEPNNLFLTSATNLRAKQQAAPLAQEVTDKYLDCLEALSSLRQEVKATNVNVEFGRQNAAETISAVRDSQAWRLGFGGRGAGGRDPFDETMELMDKLDLNLSPKEAKRTLTKDQYREWKKLKAKQEAKSEHVKEINIMTQTMETREAHAETGRPCYSQHYRELWHGCSSLAAGQVEGAHTPARG
jgi:MoxR-like ATPase